MRGAISGDLPDVDTKIPHTMAIYCGIEKLLHFQKSGRNVSVDSQKSKGVTMWRKVDALLIKKTEIRGSTGDLL